MLQPNVPATATVLAELSRWEQNYVDVAALRSRTEQAERNGEALGEKVALLERRVQVGRRMTADWLLKVWCMCWHGIAPTLSWVLEEDGWPAPRPGRFSPGKETRYKCAGGWVGLAHTGIRTPDRQEHSESLLSLPPSISCRLSVFYGMTNISDVSGNYFTPL